MRCALKHQPNLPVLELHIAEQHYVFNSLYRVWMVESILSNVLEQKYKSENTVEQNDSEKCDPSKTIQSNSNQKKTVQNNSTEQIKTGSRKTESNPLASAQAGPLSREKCESLERVRTHIDLIDQHLIELIATRRFYVDQAVPFKRTEQAVQAPERVEAVLARCASKPKHRASIQP